MEVGIPCRHAVAVENEILGGSMSNQYSIFDDCFVDSFAGGGGASMGIEMATGHPNYCKRRISDMEELHNVMTG